jgi:hypothetical protein
VLLRLQELRRLRSLERAYGNLAPLFQTAAFRESAEPFQMKQFDHRALVSAEIAVNRFFKPVTYILAAVYFLVDVAFMAVARPVSDWICTWCSGTCDAGLDPFGPTHHSRCFLFL